MWCTGAASSAPPGRSPPRRCSRSPAHSSCPPRPRRDVLVSNIGQTDDGLGSLTVFDQAQVFTTGGAYSLTSVEIDFAGVPSTGSGIHVSIWDDNGSGRPGSQVGSRLTNPASFSVGTNEFSASGIDLAAATKYYVVVDVQTCPSLGRNTKHSL